MEKPREALFSFLSYAESAFSYCHRRYDSSVTFYYAKCGNNSLTYIVQCMHFEMNVFLLIISKRSDRAWLHFHLCFKFLYFPFL